MNYFTINKHSLFYPYSQLIFADSLQAESSRVKALRTTALGSDIFSTFKK